MLSPKFIVDVWRLACSLKKSAAPQAPLFRGAPREKALAKTFEK
jgi:hypothetical protein